MRPFAILILAIGLADPALAQADEFRWTKRWLVVDTLNGANVRDRALTFFADTSSPESTYEPTAVGFAGCNNWRARWEMKEPDEFRLGPIATTRMMCPEGNAMRLEQDYVAALSKVVRWRVEGQSVLLIGEQTVLRLSPHSSR